MKLSIADMVLQRDRLERLLSVLPSYAQEGIQKELDKLNEELRKAIEADYELRWDRMSVEDKKAVLQSIHEWIATELGMEPLDLQFKDIDALGNYNDGERKFWFDADETIKIDSENLTGNGPYTSYNSLMDTVAHETRHQYQEYLVNHPDESPPHISEEQIEEWKDNLDNYIKPEDDFEAYLDQPVEVDARDYAESYAEDFYENEAENYSS